MEIARAPNYWGISVIFALTAGECIGPTGDISPVVTLLKKALHSLALLTCPILVLT